MEIKFLDQALKDRDYWKKSGNTKIQKRITALLKDKTAKGLFYGALNSGSTQVLNLVTGIFLAYNLSLY